MAEDDGQVRAALGTRGLGHQQGLAAAYHRGGVVLDELQVGKLNTQAQQLGLNAAAVELGARDNGEHAAHAAAGDDHGVCGEVQQLAAPDVAHAHAAAAIAGGEQGLKAVVAQALHRALQLVGAQALDEHRHDLLARLALCKDGAGLALPAEGTLRQLSASQVEASACALEPFHDARRRLRHVLDVLLHSKAGGR